MASYLLTGTAGFIGSRVAEMLLDEGHAVVGVDNMNRAYDVRLKEYRLKQLKKRRAFAFKKMDICDRKRLWRLGDEAGGFDAVINLAARAGVRASLLDPWVYVETNMTGTLNLLELCRNHKVEKFILASTSSVYGAEAPLPTPEEAESGFPLQPYAASKKAAEAMSHAYHYLYGIDVTVFRYFTVYGPAGRPDTVTFRFIQALSEGRPLTIFGDGEQTRGFTYVDDIARGTILGLKPVGYEIINLGGHEMTRVNELVRILEGLIGNKAELRHQPRHPADMEASWANVEKAGRVLGWEPQIALAAGMAKVVDWYRQERRWASLIDTGD
ncbi:MAG: SDR family NAD(P)-dependent oxidoreductase [Anaerolineales bacterium]|jgi:nucleoside-diphosphate-sugar epimerase